MRDGAMSLLGCANFAETATTVAMPAGYLKTGEITGSAYVDEWFCAWRRISARKNAAHHSASFELENIVSIF